MDSLTHSHFLTMIYTFDCRACEIARFERQLPLGGNKAELIHFVLENPTLTYWDKEHLIEKFDLQPAKAA